jgi:hypothetical protein
MEVFMNPNAALKKSPPAPILHQIEVEKVLALRETHKALKDRLELMDKALREAEGDVLAKLDAGADLAHCGYAVSVQVVERRYPAWKEEFIARLGKAHAGEVLESTEPTVYRKVVVK